MREDPRMQKMETTSESDFTVFNKLRYIYEKHGFEVYIRGESGTIVRRV